MDLTPSNPNELESNIHKAAPSSSNKVHPLTWIFREFPTILQQISTRQAESGQSIIPDPSAGQDALTFFLAVGLLKPLKDSKGNNLFRAVTKNELGAYVIGAFRYPFTNVLAARKT